MKQNKSGKYFKYALGEIILVVIGILIALQINNWNNKRIDNIREANYIKNIERDLNSQLKAIDAQIDFETQVSGFCKTALLRYNETNLLKMDNTLALALGAMTSRRTFLNPNPAYTELISSGSIELLKNESFKDQLINYYLELERIERVIASNNSLYTDQEFIPTILKLGVIKNKEKWTNAFRDYDRQYSTEDPLTEANFEHLLEQSNKLLKNKENELLLVNHLAFRKSYALGHVFFLLEFKAQTKNILKSLKNYHD